jgi:nicotinate-nucleotide adenylyltransferase
MRIGVFGGTFDPVHTGHLISAEQAREQARLDAVWFVPAPHPPHKDTAGLTRFDYRVEMLRLAIAGNPAFRVDEVERDRPGPSYTADTLAELSGRHPGHEFFLLLGSDALHDLPTWHEPARVLERAGLLVTTRPGHAIPDAAELRVRLGLAPGVPLRLQAVVVPAIDISSHDLRARAAAGHSLRYFLPRAVECYILDKGLYRPGRG